MYGKIFSSMYDGSLYGQWEAIVTMQQLIVLCDIGGVVDMTPQAIAARTSIPLEIIQKGIELLMQPDKYSRTPDCDGRRIELIDDRRPWGWHIVNYDKYRFMASAEEKREADRVRIAEKRAKSRVSQDVAESRDQSQQVANVAYAEAEEEVKKIYVAHATDRDLEKQILDVYHELLPTLPAVKIWGPEERRQLNDRIRETVKRGMPADGVDYWRRFFGKVAASDFLCGRTKDPWRCGGLKWLIKPKNFAKVIEGNYDNQTGGTHGRSFGAANPAALS
jgi:hypothetical protein